jgi:hypothetical protein
VEHSDHHPFEIHNHYHFHESPGAGLVEEVRALRETVDSRLGALTLGTYSLAQSVNTLEDTVATDLTALTTEVSENGDVIASAVSVLGSLAQQIRDLSTDPAALQALADTLDQNTNALATAIADTSGGTTPTP